MRLLLTWSQGGSLVTCWRYTKSQVQLPSYGAIHICNFGIETKEKCLMGSYRQALFLPRGRKTGKAGTGAIAWYTRDGLEAAGLEAVGGSLYREHRSTTRRSTVIGIHKYAFISLHEGGSLHSWGQHFWGGELPATYERLSCAREIQSTNSAFAALFEDQTVRAWGNAKAGGDITRVQHELWGVQWIQANFVSFFALRADLTVIV